MTLNEYQQKAARTMNPGLDHQQTVSHSLFEMCSETGEIHAYFQKQYQGHDIDYGKLKLEVGDLLWGLAEFCTAHGWELDTIAEMNIEKLKRRYPDRFDSERSVHRELYEDQAGGD